MKNKRWKRVAKRVKGKRLIHKDCFKCDYDNKCKYVIRATGLSPYMVGIRDLERIYKNI